MKMLYTLSTGDFVLSIDVQYSYYIRVCALLSCLELHSCYSNTHAHDVGAHAYYSNSGITRVVRTCCSGYSGYSDSLLENDGMPLTQV